MKKIIQIILAAFIIICSMSFIISKKEWYLFESKEDGFKIEFPGKPVCNQQEIVSAKGKTLTTTICMYDVPNRKRDDNYIYSVNSAQNPDFINISNDKEKASEYFQKAIDNSIKGLHGKFLSETVVNLRGYSGRHVRVDFRDGEAVINMRIYLVKDRFYILQIATDSKKDFNSSINHFMDSFDVFD